MLTPALLAALLATQGPCPIALPDGASIRGDLAPNPEFPRFTVHNRQADPIFVKLVHHTSDAVHVFFVGAHSSVEIPSIPPGDYLVSYAVDGRLGADCATLVQAKSAYQFEGAFTFYRRSWTNPDGSVETEIGDNWIDLGGETRNNAEATRITLERFNG